MINPFENPEQRRGYSKRGFSKYIKNLCEGMRIGEAAPVENDEIPYGTVRVLLTRHFKGRFESTTTVDGVIWIKRKK